MNGHYSTTVGYKCIKEIPHVPRDPEVWESIWNPKYLPKVDHFVWNLAHNSVLTAEVLQKKGWEGPSRCPLYLSAKESTSHLFLFFPYAKEVWHLATSPWNAPLNFEDVPSLLHNW